MSHRHARPQALKRMRGFVLMAAALLLGIVSMAVLLSSLSSTDAATQQAIKTQLALKEAKEAVLGYILLDSGATMKPGSIACPDQDNDNDSDFYDYAGDCKYGIYTYRFPGKQFRTGELRDSANEKLWYAISPAFRAGAPEPLNSLTPATLQIDGQGEYVAAVIAPGAPLAGQSRTDPTVRTHFLEQGNATGTQLTTPATVPPSDQLNFNDRLIGISHKEWEDTVVRRVVSELTAKLKDYLKTKNYLPLASPLIPSPTRSIDALPKTYAGFLPVKELWPEPVPVPPAYKPVTQAQKNEDWFAVNEWYKLIYYVVAPAFVDGAARNCDILADCLTLKTNGKVITGIKALVIYAGVALPEQNQNRNRAEPTVADYLEGAENRDGNNVFEAAPTGPNTNDRFYIIR